MTNALAVQDGASAHSLVITDSQIKTLKQTIAADTNMVEFDLFMEVCRRTRLDPFRKQIFPLVFGKTAKDQSKRRMSIVVAQDGLRSIAARSKDYRPDENEPAYTYTDYELERRELIAEAKKISDLAKRKARIAEIDKHYPVDPLNPCGIEKVTVTLHKMGRDGIWHPVNGTAYWSEFAPIKELWSDDNETGRRKPTGRKTLDQTSHWPKAPRLMIAKCATMQALRAGWPDDYTGLYAQEEMDRALAEEATASERLAHHEAESRLAQVGARANEIPFSNSDGSMVFAPVGVYFDTVMGALRQCRTVPDVQALRMRNQEGLKRFWAVAKSDALGLRDELDATEKRLTPAKKQVTHEDQGTGHDSGASGHELQGRASR